MKLPFEYGALVLGNIIEGFGVTFQMVVEVRRRAGNSMKESDRNKIWE